MKNIIETSEHVLQKIANNEPLLESEQLFVRAALEGFHKTVATMQWLSMSLDMDISKKIWGNQK